MKTAISIPDTVFESAEKLARLTKKSRSQLFSDAVTTAMDRVCEELGDTRPDSFVSLANRHILKRVEW